MNRTDGRIARKLAIAATALGLWGALVLLFAAPLAWFIMNKFLEEFTYKEEMGPSMFLIGLGATLSIALLTVGYKSIKSATANPVDSLRSE